MNNDLIMRIPCRRVTQNNVEFLLGAVKAHQLMQVVSVTSRAITDFDEQGMPIYNEFIQRKPNVGRVNAIKDYLIADEESCFPNSILVSVPPFVIEDEISDGTQVELSINLTRISTEGDKPLYLQIFDGQHRFRGLQVAIQEMQKRGNSEKLFDFENFEFVVSFFVGVTPEFQAMMFSLINRTPVKVPQDLVYDLFGLTREDSPQKTCLAIALELNSTKYSDEARSVTAPFYKRIKLLAKKVQGEESPISQSIFIKSILLLISTSLRASEIDRLLPRKALTTGGNERTIFRAYYAQGKDNIIFRILLNYFTVVKELFVDENDRSYWDIDSSQDSIPVNAFQKTIGFSSLIDLLVKIMPFAEQAKDISKNFFREYLIKARGIQLLDSEGKTLFQLSSKGRTELSQKLIQLVFSN